jgi:hypothetical protein
MQSRCQGTLEQRRKLPPVDGRAGPSGKVLKQLPRVVRLAEERTIESLRGFAHAPSSRQSHDDAEDRTGHAA